ncbi:uncharacterized protein OCT59_004396 [Rhizophagus irregularis]|uniref:uncharacterized protein n=1 Tax=Rhizophagus irregularis TaxID=588596 RepID=UPI003316933C|nr:hypothetical protein OCT59_004396 [Rhizophagus irregularis]
MNTLENSSKTGVKNLWKEWDEIHQIHTTIFSTDTTIKSDETNSFFKKINIMDLEKRKEVYGYYESGNLRNNVMNDLVEYKIKIPYLFWIIDGLSAIHDAGKVHKDLHSGNILVHRRLILISDLGMCQSVNDNERKGIYGVMPYMAPEVLRGYQYTTAADIYSFGIIMNELMSEEIAFNDIPHDRTLAVKICKGFRPKISEDTPKLIGNLIIKCWDAKAENRPTAKELFQLLRNYFDELNEEVGEIYSQIEECEKIKENKLKNRTKENKPKNLQTHPQAIYTSRLLNFKNLPEPVNSIDYLSSFQEPISSTSANPISERLNYELSELDLNQDDIF